MVFTLDWRSVSHFLLVILVFMYMRGWKMSVFGCALAWNRIKAQCHLKEWVPWKSIKGHHSTISRYMTLVIPTGLTECNNHLTFSMPCFKVVFYFFIIGCCSVAKLCQTLCDPMDCSTPGFPVLHHLPDFAQTHVPESVMLSNHSSSAALFFCLQYTVWKHQFFSALCSLQSNSHIHTWLLGKP